MIAEREGKIIQEKIEACKFVLNVKFVIKFKFDFKFKFRGKNYYSAILNFLTYLNRTLT